MKICNHCGAQLLDEAVMCPKCGYPAIGSGTNQKPSGISIAALICAFFIPLLGWILGGIGKKNAPNNVSRDLSVAGIVIATIVFVINLLLL